MTIVTATLRDLLGSQARVACGGVGTGLQAFSLEAGQPPEELALDAPGDVVEVHRSFLDAGADVILTDTFGANAVRLGHSKYADVELVNQAALGCAREAVERSGRDALVAGSLGPTGELLEPLGALDPGRAREAYAEQATALSGCDFLVVETMFSLDEAAAAVQGAREGARLPVVVSFSFDAGTDSPRTMMGHSVADVVRAAGELGVDGVGFNCGTSLERARLTADELAAALEADGSGLVAWAKPNAGMPDPLTGAYPAQPEDMASFAAWALTRGIDVVGGCCGTTGAHLEAIARALR